MLLVYRKLEKGGIEGCWLRLARYRFKSGLKTKVLLISTRRLSCPEMLSLFQEYCEVYFLADLLGRRFEFLSFLAIIYPFQFLFSKNRVKHFFSDFSNVHVSDVRHAFWCYCFFGVHSSVQYPISIGNYWHDTQINFFNKSSYFKKTMLKFMLGYVPKENLVYFSEHSKRKTESRLGVSLENASVCFIGVVDNFDYQYSQVNRFSSNSVRMVCVARLVPQKKYLLGFGIMLSILSVKYPRAEFFLDVFGYGELEPYLESQEKENKSFCLKGPLEPNDFERTVGSYDLYLGSGISAIQAAAIGIPTIPLVDDNPEPSTLGWFYQSSQHDYNSGSGLPLKDVSDLIISFAEMDSSSRHNIGSLCRKSSKKFSIRSFNKNLQAFINPPEEEFSFSVTKFIFSYVVYFLTKKIKIFRRI